MPQRLKTAFHSRGLDRAIAQLNTIVKPDFTLVDGTCGDLRSETGYNPVEIGMALVGTEPAAVDAVVAGFLGFKPHDIKHIAYSLEYRGIDPKSIEKTFLNTPEREKTLKVDTEYESRYPCRIRAGGTCCTCNSNLLFALERLHKLGRLNSNQYFVIGQKPVADYSVTDSGRLIVLGKCAAAEIEGDVTIPGCPVQGSDIVEALG
jgi:hypothetical protein